MRYLFQKSFAKRSKRYVELFGQYYDRVVTKVRAYEQNTKD